MARQGCAVEVQSVPPNARDKSIGFGSCRLLPSQKWLGRSLSLPMKLPKPSLKPLSRGAAHRGCGRAAPWGASSRAHPIVKRGQSRSEKKLFISLSPSPPLQACQGVTGRLASSGLASSPSGTAAAELDTGVGAGAGLA